MLDSGRVRAHSSLVIGSPGQRPSALSLIVYASEATRCARFPVQGLNLGGQGDLVSRLIMGINGLTIWVIGVINLLTKSP